MTKRSPLVASVLIGVAIASGLCSAAPSDCKLITIAEWPVRVQHNKLIVDGAINGQKIGILLDTGAERSFILHSAAVRLGLTLRRVRGLRMFGIGGETEVQMTQVAEFQIGETTRKNWQVVVAGEHDLADGVAILLGDDFFHGADVEFDLAHGMVRLFQPKDCEGLPLAYWSTSGSSQVEIETVDDVHPHIFLTVRINGQPLRALLDSGAGVSMLGTLDAARLGVTPETPGVVAVGAGTGLGAKRVDSWIGLFHSFAIGEETIENPRIFFSDLWKDTTYTPKGSNLHMTVGLQPMLLGADFLLAHRVLVAHSQRKIYFTSAGGPMFQMGRPSETSRDPGQQGDGKPKAEN